MKILSVPVLLEVIGWYGATAILSAYFMNSFQVLQSTDVAYQLLNLTGAFGISLISFRKRAYQPAMLNTIWAFIALGAIVKLIFTAT